LILQFIYCGKNWWYFSIEGSTIGPIEPCTKCGNPTSLYFQGQPVCIDCDRKREGADESVPVRKPAQAEPENSAGRADSGPGEAFG
jgi:hypothetical protein